MDGWIQCLGHIAAGSKPIPFFSFPSDLIALGAFLRLSLCRCPSAGFSLLFLSPLYWTEKEMEGDFDSFPECLGWPLDGDPTATNAKEGLKKKVGRKTKSIASSSNEKNPAGRKGNSSPMGLRLLSPDCWLLAGSSNPHVISHPIQFDRAKLVDGDSSFSIFSPSSSPHMGDGGGHRFLWYTQNRRS